MFQTRCYGIINRKINIFGGGDPTGSAGENTFTLPGDHPHFIEEKDDDEDSPQLKQKTNEDNQTAVESKTEKKMQKVEVKPKPDSVYEIYEHFRDIKGNQEWRLYKYPVDNKGNPDYTKGGRLIDVQK